MLQRITDLTPQEFFERIHSYRDRYFALKERRKIAAKGRKEEFQAPKPEYKCSVTKLGNPKITFRKSARAEKWLTKEEINDIALTLNIKQNIVWCYVNKKKIEVRDADAG